MVRIGGGIGEPVAIGGAPGMKRIGGEGVAVVVGAAVGQGIDEEGWVGLRVNGFICWLWVARQLSGGGELRHYFRKLIMEIRGNFFAGDAFSLYTPGFSSLVFILFLFLF